MEIELAIPQRLAQKGKRRAAVRAEKDLVELDVSELIVVDEGPPLQVPESVPEPAAECPSLRDWVYALAGPAAGGPPARPDMGEVLRGRGWSATSLARLQVGAGALLEAGVTETSSSLGAYEV